MPAWVARKYPETLAMKADGTRIVWGVRKNNCFTNGTYRLLSERITRAMAEHYARTPNVIGWQTDNEFGGTDCRCPLCRNSFQDWLRRKYGTLDELNRAWGTHFWGLKVQSLGRDPDSRLTHRSVGEQQPEQPASTGNASPRGSTSASRATRSRSCVRSARRHFVTHNFMGLFQEMDYYDLAKDLDFVSWDNYPVFANWEKPGIPYDASLAADVMRGLKGRNFWIMEQTAGPLGWDVFSRNPRPGEIRSISYQQLAHGADGQLWFRWRSCTAGREQYWHGLLGHDGKPGAATARRLRWPGSTAASSALSPELTALAGRLRLRLRQPLGAALPAGLRRQHLRRCHPPLLRCPLPRRRERGHGAAQADLSGYKLVLAPDLFVMPDTVARKLVSFVEGGGVLLADLRTGVKDETNLVHPRTLPGLLAPALGIAIEEYEALAAVEYPMVSSAPLSGDFTAVRYADWITPNGAQVVSGYADWPVKEYAAVTRHRFGKGRGWYVGTVVKQESFYDQLVKALLDDAGIKPVVVPPEGVEVAIREGGGKALLFILNHTTKPKSVRVPSGKRELLTQQSTTETLELGSLGVAVLEM